MSKSYEAYKLWYLSKSDLDPKRLPSEAMFNHVVNALGTATAMFEKVEDEGREMSVPEVLAETLSNVNTLKNDVKILQKLNANLVGDYNSLQAKYGKAFNDGVSEGRSQVQDDIDASERCNAELRCQVEMLSEALWDDVEEIDVDIGDNVIDDMTGYSGVITRVTEYADGSFQAYVETTINKALHGSWFELDRLREVK